MTLEGTVLMAPGAEPRYTDPPKATGVNRVFNEPLERLALYLITLGRRIGGELPDPTMP